MTVSFQGAVGPFDAALIKSDDPTALKKWLTDNAYVVSDAAAGLIDVYVRENKYFVALKLLNGVGVRSIQPIVLTFRGTEACVPLRLTAIAANPDMPVLVWVLSDKRVAPRGFYEMKIDEARIDWLRSGTNYFGPQGLVSLAANEAGGNAFVTEYAGVSSIARTLVYSNGQINLTTLMMAMTPPVYVQAADLDGPGERSADAAAAGEVHPDARRGQGDGRHRAAVLRQHQLLLAAVRVPALRPRDPHQRDLESIVTPRIEAQMMIDSHPYLTRLNTFISPDEMNKDPFFFESARPGRRAQRSHGGPPHDVRKHGVHVLQRPDAPRAAGRADGLAARRLQGDDLPGRVSPRVAGLASLPAAEVAWQREETGEGMRVIDNTAAIAAGIAANNDKFPNEQTMFPIPSGQRAARPAWAVLSEWALGRQWRERAAAVAASVERWRRRRVGRRRTRIGRNRRTGNGGDRRDRGRRVRRVPAVSRRPAAAAAARPAASTRDGRRGDRVRGRVRSVAGAAAPAARRAELDAELRRH